MSSPPEGKLETKAGHPPAGTDCESRRNADCAETPTHGRREGRKRQRRARMGKHQPA